jgi:hypothetical protein
MSHIYYFLWLRIFKKFQANKIQFRKWDKRNIHANSNMITVSTCIHGNNRYSSQVDLSVLGKGKRESDKGVKTGRLH